MGKRVSGEDLLGLTRSFYLGGTLAVLSSLWTIEDEGPASSWRFFTRRRAEEIWQRLGSRQGTLSAQGYAPSVYGAFVLGGTDQL